MMQLEGLTGRVALVTGGARGIGRAIVEVLHEQGARVATGDLDAPNIAGVLGVALDVSDEASVEQAYSDVEAELGSVEILVLNAGIFRIESIVDTTLESWTRTLEVNLTGAFLCAKRALPSMRSAGYGRIVALGSSAGKTGGAQNVAAYAASKAGLMTLVKSIATEYAGHGIRANALAPALIDTDMITTMPDMRGRIPLGRLGTTREVADVVAFLCSDHASFVTAEITDVNGGFLID